MSDIETLRTAIGDKYVIERELGRGGMATVYLARDAKLARQVAIKVLLPDLAHALGGDRFRREIEVVTRLRHPHILALYDWGEADGLLYYVMPFVAGESLRAKLDKQHQLAIDEAVRLTCEVATALDYAHGQGIMHRDIKPENILLEQGHAVIADFGIARVMDEANTGPALTQTGVSIGTPTYMSPEQALAEKKIDGRADQYSLACVLYEMLAGHPPFSGGSLQALIMRHTMEQVPPLHIVRSTVAPELEDVIMRALAKAPADRFESCAQFAQALLSPAGFTSSYRVSVARGITHVPKRTIWLRRAAVAVGIVALAAGGAALAMKLNDGSAGDVRQMGAAASLGLDTRGITVTYFSDATSAQKLGDIASGLTEALIDELSQVPDLQVTSKNALAPYREEDAPADSLARFFKTAWIVKGTVDEVGSDVRVTVRLFDGVSGTEIAKATVTQPADKALALNKSLATEVSTLLTTGIGSSINLSASRLEAKSDAAWLLVRQADKLRRDGEAAIAKGAAPDAQKAYAIADTLLARAESLDEDWREPTTQRALVAFRRARATRVPAEQVALYREAIGHADRVIARDSLNAQASAAYEYRGMARFYLYALHLIPDPRDAERSFADATSDLERATKLASRNAGAWMTLSSIYTQKPDFASAKIAALNAYRADPFMQRAADILDRLYRTSYITKTFNDADHYCGQGRNRFPADFRFLECWLWIHTVADVRPRPSMDTVWMLADSIQKLTAGARQEFVRRESHVVAGIVLGRLGMADSAKRVLDRVMDTPRDVDPADDLLYFNAYARLTLGDRRTALDLLKTYLTRNPEHREGWGKDSAWWWDELKQDQEFQRMIATGR